MKPESQAKDFVAEWQEAQSLYPLYAALAKEFVIDVPVCADLEDGVATPPRESVEQAQQWLKEVDGKIQVHQLRQFLQTTTLVTQDSLQRLLNHHLQKTDKTASDRDKIDFLLVQFFAQCAPSGLDENDVDLDYVAQVLEPVLGQCELMVPVWLKGLEQLVQSARQCQRLSELLHSGILEQGRRLKVQCGDKYFLPVAMVAFARFSFLMRRVFFHLMHADLDAILDGLRELEQRGIHTLDCRRAQFSAEEPTTRLRMICQSWKVMFFAEYSSGQPLRMLVDLRAAIEDALKAGGKPSAAKTAAAGASAGKSGIAATKAPQADALPEFEISPAPPQEE